MAKSRFFQEYRDLFQVEEYKHLNNQLSDPEKLSDEAAATNFADLEAEFLPSQHMSQEHQTFATLMKELNLSSEYSTIPTHVASREVSRGSPPSFTRPPSISGSNQDRRSTSPLKVTSTCAFVASPSQEQEYTTPPLVAVKKEPLVMSENPSEAQAIPLHQLSANGADLSRVMLVKKIELLLGPQCGRITGYSTNLPLSIQHRIQAFCHVDKRRKKLHALFTEEEFQWKTRVQYR